MLKMHKIALFITLASLIGWSSLSSRFPSFVLNNLITSAASAQPVTINPAQPMSVEDLWRLARLGDPVLTPDGKTIILPVARFDIERNRSFSDLFALPSAGGPARQLTTDPANETEAAVSPDGKFLAFIARRDEDRAGQLWILPLDGGEARRITAVPMGVFAPKWFPDSQRLAILARVWPDLPDFEAQGKRLKEREESKMTARVWTKAPISHWDRYLDDRQVHLFITDIKGSTPISPTLAAGQPLDTREPNKNSYDLAPDGQEIAYEANSDTSGVRPNLDVYLLNVNGGPARNLTADNPATDSQPLFSPDGRWLAYTKGTIPGFYADKRFLALYSRTTKTSAVLTQNWDRTAENLIWSPDSQFLLGSIDDAATRRVYRFNLTAGMPTPITKEHDYTSLAMAGGKAPILVAIQQSFSNPPTLVRLNPQTGAAAALTSINDAQLAKTALGRVESVSYKGAGDAPIQMWVVYPPDFDPSKKYPLFLLLHGGPHNGITDSWAWRWNAQVFAGWGYVVAWHNFHGSSGFGQNFTDAINPDWASKPYEDTIKAAQWFQVKPWIDSARMVAGGGSYGGYLAAILLGRPHPFQALIAHAPVYNLYTQEASDGGASKARFYEYWENPQAYQAQSPHMAAANFKTPTLIIHGQLDYRVPINHGIEMFNTLQNKGVPSKLITYPDENHWVLKPQNSIFWYQSVQEWVEHYAKPGGQEGVGQ
jgi:dipeptidyl aminopeptidase/acylaminoacyl peptidase